jgi:hypothetical protein
MPLTWPLTGWRHGESNPGPPACKLAAESSSAVAEHVRGATGGSGGRLVVGSLPYFSGVRAFVRSRTRMAHRTHVPGRYSQALLHSLRYGGSVEPPAPQSQNCSNDSLGRATVRNGRPTPTGAGGAPTRNQPPCSEVSPCDPGQSGSCWQPRGAPTEQQNGMAPAPTLIFGIGRQNETVLRVPSVRSRL